MGSGWRGLNFLNATLCIFSLIPLSSTDARKSSFLIFFFDLVWVGEREFDVDTYVIAESC